MDSSNDQQTAVVVTADNIRALYRGGRRDFRGAYLSGAYLTGADLTGAYLSGAYLTGADLTGADLTRADLTGADLTRAYLHPIWDDLYGYFGHVPHEVAGLLAAMEAGQIDGSTYDGTCACLAGTCERVRRESARDVAAATPLIDLRDAESPRERWFLRFRPGMTPENDPAMAITAQKIREWLAAHPVREDGVQA